MRRVLLHSLSVIVLGISNAALADAQRYVDVNAGGSGSGLTWDNAYTDLQDAIADASANADFDNKYTIWVADGVYRPSAPGSSEFLWTFDLPRYAEFFGGFDGGEGALIARDPRVHVAVLDGRVEDELFNVVNVVTVDGDGSERRLDGFTVRNPRAEFFVQSHRNILVSSGAVALVNLVVREGYAVNGGGVRIDTEDPGTRIVSSEIVYNEAQRRGAGVSIAGPVEILNTLIARNFMTECGIGPCGDDGGTGISDAAGSTVERTITNCTVTGNVSNGDGAGIRSDETGLVVVNSIVWGNRKYDNDPSEIVGSPIVSYSDVRGGYTGTGNIDADPQFASPGTDNFRLGSASPCLDSGLSVAVPADDLNVDDDNDTDEPTPDLDRKARIVPAVSGDCPGVDMGAFERATENDCLTGDLNEDCVVDGADLGLLLSAWGGSGLGDLNCDGEVDGADLGTLLSGWTEDLESPRDCGCESFMGGGSSESSGSGFTSTDLRNALGFDSTQEMAAWLGQQPFEEMVAYLSLLME